MKFVSTYRSVKGRKEKSPEGEANVCIMNSCVIERNPEKEKNDHFTHIAAV